jgi:N-formylglutamate amidohydrolase
MNLCALVRGDSPLVIDVPHAGTQLPPELAARFTAAARAVPDTDWHVEKLYSFAGRAGGPLVAATHSRYVVDLNRDPSGAALYPGADNTELCPTRTFDNAPIYAGAPPDDTEVVARRAAYFDPYHATLAAEVARVRALHGWAVRLDGHSIRAEVPRIFAGRLPDLNLGTAGGSACAPSLCESAVAVLAAAGFSHVVDGRFKGGWITRHLGRHDAGVHALQLEVAQACYMDEAPPYRWEPARAAALVAVLERLAQALAGWRPR